MPTLPHYKQFDGRYWDTGVIRNALDYQGVIAPHTGEPYTEAMLLGISGGITFGYFTFHYDGYDPQVNLLTRNTFEPMDTIIERLAIPHERLQTTHADKARQNLIETLANGQVPIVWADMFTLPYNGLEHDENNWAMMPVIVYGYETEKNVAYLSDRACVGLTVPAEVLDAARARVKKDKHLQLVLESPDNSRLAAAVRAGIHDCIALMTEKPPRGSANSFGLKGLQKWVDMLEKNTKESWSQAYPTGRPLLAVLISAFTFLGPGFGKTMQAERDTYASFLDEAAVVLENPALENVAVRYRVAGKAWQGLLHALLPEDVPMLKQAQELILMKYETFTEQGSEATARILELEAQLNALKMEAESDFPMTEVMVADLRDDIRRHVQHVLEAEQEAVTALQAAMN